MGAVGGGDPGSKLGNQLAWCMLWKNNQETLSQGRHEDRHLRVPSDLHTLTVACVHPHLHT